LGRLSNIPGKKAVKAFGKIGYIVEHQTGSHMILCHPERQTLSVPNHKELAPGLFRGIIRSSGLTVEEFLRYLKD